MQPLLSQPFHPLSWGTCYEPLLLNSDFSSNSMLQMYFFHCLCVLPTMLVEVSSRSPTAELWPGGLGRGVVGAGYVQVQP